jgi:tartrate-resistant acid phosphatase type 5
MNNKLMKLLILFILLVFIFPARQEPAETPAKSGDQGGGTDTPPQTKAPTASAEKISFISFGDWGDESEGQLAVASTIGTYCATASCEFIVTLGDNFQGTGVVSTADPLWQTTYRNIYGALNIPFYAALGNHDVLGSIQAQIDYSAVDSSWHMPGEFYSFTTPSGSAAPVAEFFIINAGDNRYDSNEETWLEGALAASTASWKFLILHKPILSNGDGHADNHIKNGDKLISDICDKIDLVMSGHDHIFSYLKGKSSSFDVDCTLKQLVIGTGGGNPYNFDASDTRAIKSGSFSGFGWFEATATQLTFKMIKSDGTDFYETSWTN